MISGPRELQAAAADRTYHWVLCYEPFISFEDRHCQKLIEKWHYRITLTVTATMDFEYPTVLHSVSRLGCRAISTSTDELQHSVFFKPEGLPHILNKIWIWNLWGGKLWGLTKSMRMVCTGVSWNFPTSLFAINLKSWATLIHSYSKGRYSSYWRRHKLSLDG